MSEPELTYPRTWTYSVIGTDKERIRALADEVLSDRPYLLEAGNESKGGKYVSLRLEVHVKDEADRDAIFQSLKDDPSIKMIL